jgi:hypothetical protein
MFKEEVRGHADRKGHGDGEHEHHDQGQDHKDKHQGNDDDEQTFHGTPLLGQTQTHTLMVPRPIAWVQSLEANCIV